MPGAARDKGEKTMKLEIVSANRLGDGRVVYLAREGGWSESIIDGRSARTEEDSAALLAEAERAVDDGIVVSPYLISMADDGGAFAPLRFRERIRLFGPSHRAAPKSHRAAPKSHRSKQSHTLSPETGR
jgi:sulfite reductase (NADPH) hemoprotein beta-component